ncbi:MAG: hypothetical protein DRP87_02385 [Spirochaetes bacterium]|nr:MAG: hypothetical protein DRP87_02385 [Spirochaetota bacterium]
MVLIEQIERNRRVLKRIESYYKDYISTEMEPEKRKRSDAIVISDILVNYYTCLETIFLRISQFFENDLNTEKWHQDLLEKMTLEIEDIRKAVIAEESYSILSELLKFRHFKRYYFELDYDWDKLDYLQKKFVRLQPLIREDLNQFQEFLRMLAE